MVLYDSMPKDSNVLASRAVVSNINLLYSELTIGASEKLSGGLSKSHRSTTSLGPLVRLPGYRSFGK